MTTIQSLFRGSAYFLFLKKTAESVYTICDQTGKQLLSGTLAGAETTINIRALAAGLYFISAGTASEKPAKLIKQ